MATRKNEDAATIAIQHINKMYGHAMTAAMRTLFMAHQNMETKQQMKEEIKRDVLAEVKNWLVVSVRDEASPVIKEINQQIDDLFSRHS